MLNMKRSIVGSGVLFATLIFSQANAGDTCQLGSACPLTKFDSVHYKVTVNTGPNYQCKLVSSDEGKSIGGSISGGGGYSFNTMAYSAGTAGTIKNITGKITSDGEILITNISPYDGQVQCIKGL